MTIQSSENRYELIKTHFKHLIGRRVIVEMTGDDFAQWLAYYPKNEDETLEIRSDLTFGHKYFFSFTSHLSGNRYFYKDENLLIVQEPPEPFRMITARG
jgi:hypothetical protein